MTEGLVVLDSSPYGNAADQRSNRFLLEVAAWLGRRARVVAAEDLLIGAGAAAGGTMPFAPGEVVIPRADLRTFGDLARFAACLRGVERLGVRLLLNAEGLMAAQDKLQTYERLHAAHVPAIPTWAVQAGGQLPGLAVLAESVGFPLVLRHPIGWGARGIALCHDLGALRSTLGLADHLRPREQLLLQPFVRHRAAITVLLCGDEVVGTFRTLPQAGDFRCNPRLGGRTEKIPPAPELVQPARAALAACGLRYGSVDLLEGDDSRLLVADVNAMPGLWPRERGDRRFAEALVRLACDGDVRVPRILVVTPFALGEGRGNSVSTARLVAALRAEGLPVEVVALAQTDPAAALGVARAFDPDVVHAIHALHAGPTGARIATALQIPLVLSFRGTDADDYLQDRETRGQIAFATAAATTITVLTESQAERVRAELNPRAPIRIVPHGVAPAPSARDFRGELDLRREVPLLVQVSGVRRVKGFLEVLKLVDRARALVPELHYVLAGPTLEPDLEPALRAWLNARPWAHRLGELAPADAQALLASANATLHTSLREGLSNALLESLALGIPAIARDIDATRAVLGDDRGGLTFRDDETGARAIARVLTDHEFAAQLGATGRALALERFAADAELEGYLEAYRAAVSG